MAYRYKHPGSAVMLRTGECLMAPKVVASEVSPTIAVAINEAGVLSVGRSSRVKAVIEGSLGGLFSP